jgi:hypothetical protein
LPAIVSRVAVVEPGPDQLRVCGVVDLPGELVEQSLVRLRDRPGEESVLVPQHHLARAEGGEIENEVVGDLRSGRR